MYLFSCILIFYIKVIIGLVLWGAYNHLKFINLFLFYRFANGFVNRRCRCFIVTLHFSTLPIHNSLVLFSIHNLYLRPSSALTHFSLVWYLL